MFCKPHTPKASPWLINARNYTTVHLTCRTNKPFFPPLKNIRIKTRKRHVWAARAQLFGLKHLPKVTRGRAALRGTSHPHRPSPHGQSQSATTNAGGNTSEFRNPGSPPPRPSEGCAVFGCFRAESPAHRPPPLPSPQPGRREAPPGNSPAGRRLRGDRTPPAPRTSQREVEAGAAGPAPCGGKGGEYLSPPARAFSACCRSTWCCGWRRL